MQLGNGDNVTIENAPTVATPSCLVMENGDELNHFIPGSNIIELGEEHNYDRVSKYRASLKV